MMRKLATVKLVTLGPRIPTPRFNVHGCVCIEDPETFV